MGQVAPFLGPILGVVSGAMSLFGGSSQKMPKPPAPALPPPAKAEPASPVASQLADFQARQRLLASRAGTLLTSGGAGGLSSSPSSTKKTLLGS